VPSHLVLDQPVHQIVPAPISLGAVNGRFDDESFPVGTDPGEWPANPNDATAWVATARPIVIQNAADFRTAGPRNFNSVA
jgi:hypothetical protein